MELQALSRQEQAGLIGSLSRMSRLPLDVLLGAVEFGFEESDDTTANDVKTLEGILGWGKPLRYLRDKLVPQGWGVTRHPDLETVVSPDRKFRIASANGNSNTGTDRMPTTHEDKGPLTGLATLINKQLSFPRSVHQDFGEPPVADIPTWYLLHFFAIDAETGAGQLRSELSLPSHFSGSKPGTTKMTRGFIDEWHPRLKLPAILIAPDSINEGDATEDEIQIDITRLG